MTLRNASRPLATAALLFCSAALAQTRFCIGGDLDHLSAAQKASCAAKMQTAKNVAATLQAPADWHFVVVCGENGWKDYAAYSSNQTPSLLDAAADTNLQEHETFLRETGLAADTPKAFERVVAHEVASILLHSTDEVAISHQLELWHNKVSEHNGF